MIFRTGAYGIALQNEKILLVTEPKGPFAGELSLPGGGIEPGETIEEALRREFHEEVAMTFESMQLLQNLTALTNKEGQLYHGVGLVYKVNGLQVLPHSPELKYGWYAVNELHSLPKAPFVKQILAFTQMLSN